MSSASAETGTTSSSVAVRLSTILSLVHPWLQKCAADLWAKPGVLASYTRYCIMMHGVIRASVPLMEAAALRAESLRDSDPACKALVGYLRKHLPEELHHDEWLLEDLESLSVPRRDVLNRLPSGAIANMVGAQYYWIHHVHPVAILGYIAVLEGDPNTPERVERFRVHAGLSHEAVRTVYKHALLDPHHAADLRSFLDTLTLTDAQETLVTTSAIHTAHWLTRATEEITDTN